MTDSELDPLRSVLAELAPQGRAALLPALHAAQHFHGWISEVVATEVSRALGVPLADVHGVISFYHYFRDTKPGRHTIHLCRAEACQSMNQKATEAHAKQALGVDYHATTANGAFTLEPVYCLGNCACSPAMMVDGELYGRVTPERFDAIVAEWGKR